jgi:putative PIN family toxin of toxin-antitoxin system
MRIVLDTNVLVSGLLRSGSPPGWIVGQVGENALSLCYDDRILSEYWEVLSRERFGFGRDRVASLLEHVAAHGHPTVARPLPEGLPDADDHPFLEVALASDAVCLVTGNLRHFPAYLRQGVRVLSPAEFLGFLKQGPAPLLR